MSSEAAKISCKDINIEQEFENYANREIPSDLDLQRGREELFQAMKKNKCFEKSSDKEKSGLLFRIGEDLKKITTIEEFHSLVKRLEKALGMKISETGIEAVDEKKEGSRLVKRINS